MSNQDGICLICGKHTLLRTVFHDVEADKEYRFYFDLCESCKVVPNCFTCLYSKMWYLRYKGRCDQAFKTFEQNRPDCKLYRGKRIGENRKEFWDHLPCKRYRRGDLTKNEFDEANYHD